MTVFFADPSDYGTPESDVRAWITSYLEEPGRLPEFGVPKALPVTLKVTSVRSDTTDAALVAHGCAQLAGSFARLIADDGRVEVRGVAIDAQTSTVDGESRQVVEMLPWIG